MLRIPAQAPRLESAIARIRDAKGGVLGLALLVDERHLVSCSHVVTPACDPVTKAVAVDFPWIEEGRWIDARVAICLPEQDGLDVAVLEIEGSLLSGARPLRPLLTDDLWRHEFVVFGMPRENPRGVSTSGELGLPQLDGWIQIEGTRTTGQPIVPGFSGSPVWDLQLRGVVGIVVAADRRTDLKVAFMIPTRKLIEAWPGLGEAALDIASLEYRQALLAEIRQEQDGSRAPERFNHSLAGIESEIASWPGEVERQQERIREGFAREVERRMAFAGGRLPDAGDRFKDRVREQERIGSLLLRDTTRLVSVIGRGGMGKTALVSKVLHDLERNRWPRDADRQPLDGVVCLSTRSTGISLERIFIACGEMLPEAAQSALSRIWTHPQLGAAEKVSHLLEALRPKRYVVVLDNLEDLLDERGCLTDKDLNLFFEQALLTGGVRLLVTSRVALRFRREALPYDQRVDLMEGLPVPEGATLLRELDPNGWYGLRTAPAAELKHAVEVVHGVPRALEVIASILANDPYAKLSDVTRHFFRLEEVVESLIQENYKRLDAKTRRVVEALAVFRRPVLEVALDYLLEPFEPGLNVPGLIQLLAQTGMVTVDRSLRTVMLHPIDQDYVYSQLPEGESGYTRQGLERRAADFYARLRTPPETWKTLRDVEPQLAEFEHRVRAGAYTEACKVLSSIDYEFLYKWGHYRRLVEMQEQLQGRLVNPGQQAYSLGSLGLAHYQLGEVDLAIQSYERGLAISRAAGDLWNESICLARLGNAYNYVGKVDLAIDAFQKALEIARRRDDERGEEWQLSALGNTYRRIGRIAEAVDLYQQALAIADRIGDHRGREFHLDSLGHAHLEMGETERALECFEEALGIARNIQGRRGEGLRLGSLSRAWRAKGDLGRATALGEQALAISRELGHRSDESLALVGLGWAALAAGRLEQARSHGQDALRRDVPETAHHAELLLALALLREGSDEAAGAFAAAADRCRALADRPPLLCDVRYGLALALAGVAVTSPGWSRAEEREDLLAPARAALEQAVGLCAAAGIVRRAREALEVFRAAGVEGLEPLFSALQP